MSQPSRRGIVIASALMFLGVATVGATTCGDFGLTWDEPVYRQSEQCASQWFEEVAVVRSGDDLARVLDPELLFFRWPYGRFGINFHPTLAGMLDLLAYQVFGHWMNDIAARRMGAVATFAGAVALLFGFLGRRYGYATGAVAAGALCLTPRVFADAQIAGTDAPGLFFWPLAALAFWSGMKESGGRPARVLTGLAIGLAFLVKPVSMLVTLPILLWFAGSRLRPSLIRSWSRSDWVDGVATLLPLFTLLGVALVEVRRIASLLPPPNATNPDSLHIPARLPDWFLVLPFALWLGRRLLGKLFRSSPVWGAERPALETLAAALGLAPLIAWVGNPLWWRETWPRLAHYYTLGIDRQVGALPPMPVLYFGQTHLYSSPWESGWVWIAITTPLSILAAEVIGLVWGLSVSRRDRLPLFFLLNAATLPMLRVLSIPGHDGTRLLLPSFFFLSAFAGWGATAFGDALGRWIRRPTFIQWAVACAVLIPAAIALVRVHPYEMAYYNPILGGPRGAWRRGMELTYWYDALTPQHLKELNGQVADSAVLILANGASSPAFYLETLQELGRIRPDIRFIAPKFEDLPYILLAPIDSKADAASRLLFVLKPKWSVEPAGLDGARILSLYEPRTVGISLCLQVLLDVLPGQGITRPTAHAGPAWTQGRLHFLARYWGDDQSDTPPLGLNGSILEWARTDPASLRRAARILADTPAPSLPRDPAALRLFNQIRRLDATNWSFSTKVRYACPWSIPEAVEILIRHPDELQSVVLRRGYTDVATIGGYLDRDSPGRLDGGGKEPSSGEQKGFNKGRTP